MKKIDTSKVIEMRKNGMSYSEICKETGYSKGSISKYCRGINNNFEIYEKNTKPTEDKINESQKLYDSGLSLRSVSKVVSIHRSTLSKYINKRSFKDKEVIRKNKIESVKKWKRKLKEELVELKGGKCVICGYNKSFGALHFHHIDPKEKDFGISGGATSKENMIKELEKCILVCSNCHCEIHDEIQEKGYSSIVQ